MEELLRLTERPIATEDLDPDSSPILLKLNLNSELEMTTFESTNRQGNIRPASHLHGDYSRYMRLESEEKVTSRYLGVLPIPDEVVSDLHFQHVKSIHKLTNAVILRTSFYLVALESEQTASYRTR